MILDKIKFVLLSIWDTIWFWISLPFKIYTIMKEKDLNLMGALKYMELQYQRELDRLEKMAVKIRNDNREKIYKMVIKKLRKKGYKIK